MCFFPFVSYYFIYGLMKNEDNAKLTLSEYANFLIHARGSIIKRSNSYVMTLKS